uniref:Uncharacterized protein n=1 Tax=Salix viminalis TaxID=40686 RepID=A0A6N2LF19_SALVM
MDHTASSASMGGCLDGAIQAQILAAYGHTFPPIQTVSAHPYIESSLSQYSEDTYPLFANQQHLVRGLQGSICWNCGV